jgi:hypothetical protein
MSETPNHARPLRHPVGTLPHHGGVVSLEGGGFPEKGWLVRASE